MKGPLYLTAKDPPLTRECRGQHQLGCLQSISGQISRWVLEFSFGLPGFSWAAPLWNAWGLFQYRVAVRNTTYFQITPNSSALLAQCFRLVLKFCTEQQSITAIFWANFQNDWAAENDVHYKRDKNVGLVGVSKVYPVNHGESWMIIIISRYQEEFFLEYCLCKKVCTCFIPFISRHSTIIYQTSCQQI